MKKNKFVPDDSLRVFAKDVTRALNFNKDSDQKKQVESLMFLEEEFRKSICKYEQSREIYKAFVLMVAVENKYIRSAMPYFREKAKLFNSQILPAIKIGNINKLRTFHINYNLIKFIRDRWLGDFPEECERIYNDLINTRKKIIENNLPLVINRAKIFYRKVPENHVTLMDMISVASIGLVSGVDKWSGPYSRVFNGVCIGRMTGNLIDAYSETTIHFYPSDRSILYRANSLRFKKGINDVAELAKAINKSYEDDVKNGMKVPIKNKVSAEELSSLMSASSVISSEEISAQFDDENLSALHGEDGILSMEEDLIKKQLMEKMNEAIKELPIVQQKALRLKGSAV